MASEHPSHYNPYIPCNWEALEQALSSWQPWEVGRLPGMAQPAWIVPAWVPEPYLLMAQLLAPPPSNSSPSLPYPILLFTLALGSPAPLLCHYVNLFPLCSQQPVRTQERRLGLLLLRKGESCCFWEREK